MARLSPVVVHLVVVIGVLPLSSAVDVEGYLGTACNGENLFGVNGAVAGTCCGLAEYTQADSLTFANFATGGGLFLYSDNDCKDMVNQVSTEECFLVSPRAAVWSFRSSGGS